jgi:hypothetical protein
MVSILGSESFVDFVYKMATAPTFHHYQQALEHHSHNTIKESNPPLLKKSNNLSRCNLPTFSPSLPLPLLASLPCPADPQATAAHQHHHPSHP